MNKIFGKETIYKTRLNYEYKALWIGRCICFLVIFFFSIGTICISALEPEVLTPVFLTLRVVPSVLFLANLIGSFYFSSIKKNILTINNIFYYFLIIDVLSICYLYPGKVVFQVAYFLTYVCILGMITDLKHYLIFYVTQILVSSFFFLFICSDSPFHPEIGIMFVVVSGFILLLNLLYRINILDDALRASTLQKREVEKLKRAEERVSYLAYYDDLTGLPNRKLFIEILNRHIEHSNKMNKVFSLLYVDLDEFSKHNDAMGREFGDSILRETSLRLKKLLREDDQISRFTVDEFVVFLSELNDKENAITLANKVLNEIREEYIIGDKVAFLSASVGITFFPDDGDQTDKLIHNSNLAMQQAKRFGKNTYCVYEEKTYYQILARVNLEKEILQAMENKEFELYFQPIMDHQKMIYAMEALVRWNSKNGEVISPAKFIPIAENLGVIHKLGLWILEEACKKNMHLQDLGYPSIKVCVNLSPLQMQNEDLPKMIEDILERTNMAGNKLELEITESSAMADPEKSIRILNEIHEMGIFIAIDDFGTGFSSLSKLPHFPIDVLKIDKSFIDPMMDSKQARITVTSILIMAHSLRFKAVGEGVETEEQFETLKKLGCHYFQGYFFSKPLNFDNFIGMFSKNRTPYLK